MKKRHQYGTDREWMLDYLKELSKDPTTPWKNKKRKSASLEHIADLYLAELAQKKKPAAFLNDFLDEKSIFYTHESVDECLKLLLKHKFITLLNFGFSTIKISRDNDVWVRRLAETWPVPACAITDAGLHFVMGGQVLDVVRREKGAAEKKGWQDKIIVAVIGLTSALIAMAVKYYFIDKK